MALDKNFLPEEVSVCYPGRIFMALAPILWQDLPRKRQLCTIWRGTPAKYDMENFHFSWQDLHKN